MSIAENDHLLATKNFRWLVEKSGERTLQQEFIDKRFPIDALIGTGGREWRDIPEEKEDDAESPISQLSQREIFFVFKQVAYSSLSWLEQYQGNFNTLGDAKRCAEDCCKRHGDYGEVALFGSDGFKKIWTYEELGNLSSEMFGWFEV